MFLLQILNASILAVAVMGLSVPGDQPRTPIDYVSKSTATPDATTPYAAGSDLRRERLHVALSEVGVSVEELTTSREFRGSPALRMYSSFVLPKSEGGLAMAESPQRAVVIADSISFMLREHRSHQEEWMCNHDRSLSEAESLGPRHPLIIILDNVRSAHNVGNILRAAEAGGLEHVYLCGITPAPPNNKVLKTALGSAQYVPHTVARSTLEIVRDIQSQGVSVWGVETTSRSTPLWSAKMNQPVALVFGNELVGVDTEVLKACDGLVSVPTYGVKNSLNIATCASILIWETLRQWDGECENNL